MDVPDTDTPERDDDKREKPRCNAPLAFLEYKDVGVGLGVEVADGLEYSAQFGEPSAAPYALLTIEDQEYGTLNYPKKTGGSDPSMLEWA
ncbi:unnamed protein product [Phytophthora fragariaefolia]|uniref:Unnamed protein product n=1 Tax=Phytophthora fragariaefolia TaxID=1490495 RepID=A0A9W7CYL7_9STRA|nr:unnamed protein product [Phytophthora fragariaefolia]